MIQQLEELISQMPSMPEKEFAKLQHGISKLLPPETKQKQLRLLKDKCERLHRKFPHPVNKKQAALENAVNELKQPLPGIIARFNEATRRPVVAQPGSNHQCRQEDKNKAVNGWTQDTSCDSSGAIRDELTSGIRASLNKVTWSNFDVIMSTMGGQLSALSDQNMLDETQADSILAMMTRHTEYMECYGQMWSELADAFPCLRLAEKKLLGTYMLYYCQEEDLASRDRAHNPWNDDRGVALLMARRHRAALNSFLMHAMKHSTTSYLREGLSEKLAIMVHRVKVLREGGRCHCREFNSIVSDILVFMREGWEVLYREEVWPLAFQQVEEIIEHLRKQRVLGRQVELRILFQLQEMVRDVTAQGGHHTS